MVHLNAWGIVYVLGAKAFAIHKIFSPLKLRLLREQISLWQYLYPHHLEIAWKHLFCVWSHILNFHNPLRYPFGYFTNGFFTLSEAQVLKYIINLLYPKHFSHGSLLVWQSCLILFLALTLKPPKFKHCMFSKNKVTPKSWSGVGTGAGLRAWIITLWNYWKVSRSII